MEVAPNTIPIRCVCQKRLKEYLPGLQEQQKWSRPTSNFAVGDVVLMVDENSPRNLWLLGRILEVKPNKGDGLVRKVTLKTNSEIHSGLSQEKSQKF